MTQTEYDEDTCITAEELRDMGLDIPPEIPGCAWIPKYSIKCEVQSVTHHNGETIILGLSVTFDEPFTWIDLTVGIDTD
jgi:hypothetical protein